MKTWLVQFTLRGEPWNLANVQGETSVEAEAHARENWRTLVTNLGYPGQAHIEITSITEQSNINSILPTEWSK